MYIYTRLYGLRQKPVVHYFFVLRNIFFLLHCSMQRCPKILTYIKMNSFIHLATNFLQMFS